MLKIILATFMAAALNHFAANAQDTMFKLDGEQLEVKVLEITASEVRYKLTSNLDGPTYVLPKSEVFMLEYANGSKDVFAGKPKPVMDTLSPQLPLDNRLDLEKKYRSRKGAGIAGVVIGGISLIAGVPVAVDGFIKLVNKQSDAERAIIGTGFTIFGTLGLAVGIDQLVKASALKIRLMNLTSSVQIRPDLMDATTYNGPLIIHGNGVGLRVTYQF